VATYNNIVKNTLNKNLVKDYSLVSDSNSFINKPTRNKNLNIRELEASRRSVEEQDEVDEDD